MLAQKLLQTHISQARFAFTAPGALDPRITYTGASPRNHYNSVGTLTQVAIDVARANDNQDYNPATLAARGFLIEEARTNSIRNPRAEGAVAGSPGTLPTNWGYINPTGVSTQIVGAGTEDGTPYIDIRFFGTPTSTGNIQLTFEPTATIAAASGQTWTQSQFVKLAAGLLTNVGAFNTAPFVQGSSQQPATSFTLTAAGLRTQRKVGGVTTTAGATFVTPVIYFGVTNGQAIDFTLRIGAPQLELGAFATSVILPPVGVPAATTRAADVATITDLSTIGFSATQGTFFAEFMLEGLKPADFHTILVLNDGTFNNRIVVSVDGNNGQARFIVTSGGAAQANMIGATISPFTLVKIAATWSGNSFRLSVNGTNPAEDTAGTVPVVTQLQIGRQVTGNYLNGWIPKISYTPIQASQAQLNAMTAP